MQRHFLAHRQVDDVAVGDLGDLEQVSRLAFLERQRARYVLQRVTGAFAFLGTRPADGPAPPNHSNRMVVNESALPNGVAMHVALALDVLNGR